ncbi:PQQ-dependent sugar dehydrogenase [Kineosporia rhizophila]|uniref:PQQ-dependent sugar dehydrogenase n=1 Tax=Kineosporia rhizophila TaxID=84633 RepID=UPI001E4F1654|nr:PQQ-dependent sugar dehydrogenase [Kineosporia rhizophila]MCE0535778.1 PQQ-dependent sugar dehydrogenase [Kineosporia rhizophila]
MPARSLLRIRLFTLLLAGVLTSATVLAMVLANPASSRAADNAAGHHGAKPAAEAPGDPDDPVNWENYEKILLTKDTGEPIDLAVLPDRRVLTTARDGVVRLVDPTTGVSSQAGKFDVYNNSEDGLQTVTLDPGFAENGWVYFFYAPKTMDAPYPASTPAGSAPNTLPAGQEESYWDQWKGYNQLSRVKFDLESGKLDLESEQVIIKVEVQRGQCCHVAGDVDFDAEGNLYLATGDNTPASTPGANGFAPNNDRPGYNPGFDSRRGAGNTNDLRGKILRIKVAADGSYTVPEGNLYPEGTAKTRPEIFVQGVRNPFRIDVDPETKSVSWGDYGPDSAVPSAERGPMGLVEWQTTGIDKPMNSGWPYCTGNNFNYNEWNFETSAPGEFFDCAAGAENNSRWNTGLDTLPPATPATLYYGDDADDQPWPELTDFDPQGGQGPMGGPVYHYDADNASTTKFPEYWDDKAFFAEFSQDYLAAFTLEWPAGPVSKIEHFLPNKELTVGNQAITDSPIDIEFGPDGSLYVLDYGDGFFRQNPDAGLYRIDWAPGNKSPQARITADPVSGSKAPLKVEFSAEDSVDPEGKELKYEWDFDADGTFDATGVTTSYTYEELGRYTPILRVTDPEGKFGLTSTAISVGNVAPTVNVTTPADGSFFKWGDGVPFTVTTNDAEDGTATVCNRVSWTFGLGHDLHAHPLSQGSGCTFTINTPADAQEHGATENIFGVVVIRYTDAGANGVPAATGEVSMILNPDVQQAEWADEQKGVEIVDDAAAGGLRKVTSFDEGDHLGWDPVNLDAVGSVTVASSGAGTLKFHWGEPTAEPFAELAVDSAAIAEKTVKLTEKPKGTGKLFVTSSGGVILDQLTFVKGDGGGGEDPDDTTPPAVTVTGIEAGASIGDSKSVKPAWEATDEGGLDTVAGTLDGAEIKSGAEIPLWNLDLGKHTVSVTATDKAGLKTTKTVEFTTVTSFADVKALVTQFRKDGKVTKAGAVLLQAELETARQLKNPKKKVTALKVFSASVTKAIVKDADVRAALKRDAADLIKQVQK